jgi:hypothetical protein
MDMQIRYEKLLVDAAECAVLRDLATDAEKRELFARLSEHLGVLASLMERAAGLQRARGVGLSSQPMPERMPTPEPARAVISET